jgi:Arc/MetJ-type ribon-helix-helix transcriptional regulator
MLKGIDKTVSKGLYKNRSEAVNEALRMFLRQYEMGLLERKMKVLAEKNVGRYSATRAIVKSHEEED